MPNYDYICRCGNEFEDNRSIDDRNNAVCPKCGASPRIKIGAVAFQTDVLRTNGKAGLYNIGLGKHYDSKSEMLKDAKRKGLEWVGDDPLPKNKKPARKEVDWNAVAHDLDKAGVKN